MLLVKLAHTPAGAVLAGAALTLPLVFAQDPAPERTSPPRGAHGGEEPGAEEDADREIVQLFGKIERRLQEIDSLLFQAASGESAPKALEESGIAELIQRSQRGSEAAVREIDRILELARSHSHPGGGS